MATARQLRVDDMPSPGLNSVAGCPCRQVCATPDGSCDKDLDGASPLPREARTVQEVMAALPLFEGIRSDVLARLLAESHVIHRRRSSLLFGAGDEADCFYVVLDGAVKLFALAQDGRESIVEIFGPGTSFAEAAVLSNSRFPLHAEVIEDATLVRIGRRPFIQTLRLDRGLAYRMLATLIFWNKRLDSEIRHLKVRTPWQRVSDFLLSLTDVQDGPVEIVLPFNKEVLASRVGIRRESLSRVLGRLRALGVHTSGTVIRIDDVAVLRRSSAESGGPDEAG